MHGCKVLNLLRGVSPGSMPWNDLYGTARAIAPGLMYPPVAIGPSKGHFLRRGTEPCAGIPRRFYSAGVLGALLYIRRAAKKSRRTGDRLILHVHNPSLTLVAMLAKLFAPSVIIVGNLHGQWRRFTWLQRSYLSLLVRGAQKFICVSEAVCRTLPSPVAKRLRDRNALTYIPNGIPTRHLDAKFPAACLSEKRKPALVVAARMVPVKNPAFTLKVFAELQHAERLIWFGDGVERANMKQLAMELGIAERVDFRGERPRSEVFASFRACAAYMACSRSEGFSVAPVEAAALGCRPFLSDIPAHRDLAAKMNLETYPLDDLNAWTSAIDAFLAARVDQSSFRSELAIKVRSAFDLERSVKDYIEVYHGLSAPVS